MSVNPVYINYHCRMTLEEARLVIVEGVNYAAYKEMDSSLHDSDKNRLLGSEHYKSDRVVVKPSPWSEGDFEEKMATLLRLGRHAQPFRACIHRGTEASRR